MPMCLYQISRILIHSCPDLVLALDLKSLQPGLQTLEVKNSQAVSIENLNFDPRFENRQTLKMIFSNVLRASLVNLEVTETLQVWVEYQ